MTTPEQTRLDYPHKVLEATRQYVSELLVENDALKEQLALSAGDQSRLRRRLDELEASVSTDRAEQLRLAEERLEIERRSREQTRRFAEIEQQNGNLANLYVASYQLHGSLDHSEVQQAIKEIVINLIGSEEFGIYQKRDGELLLVDSAGTRAGSTSIPDTLASGLARSLETAETVVTGDDEADGTPIVFVPLRLSAGVVGAIVIFELLAHKTGLESVDFELFELLAAHAAPALYLAELHAEQQVEAAGVTTQ